jgi:hypothetical protein
MASTPRSTSTSTTSASALASSLETDEKLSKLVHSEAEKSGISAKDARKAFKKLKAGGMMAQIAPTLHSQFMTMNPTLTPRDKLRMKIKNMQGSRNTKASKVSAYEKTREQATQQQDKDDRKKADEKAAELRKRQDQVARLKDLESIIGDVSHEYYNTCLDNLNKNQYTDDSLRARDKDIVDLYSMQQKFTSTLDMGELDDI